MIPYFNKPIRIHYFGNDSLLIDGKSQLFFNHAETILLEKIDGKKTLLQISKTVADEINTDQHTVIFELLVKFIEREEFIDLIELINQPKDNLVMFTGEKGALYPLNILLEITDKCNLKCVHCYKEAGYSKSNDLDFSKLSRKLEELSKHVNEIQVSGGEPMSHKNFSEIITFIKTNFNTTSITTAGTLITSKNIHLLKGLSNVQVSLYSYLKEKHEKVTLLPNSFEKTLRGIKLLSEEEIYTTITTIVTSENIYELELLIEKAIEVGADEIKFGEFSRSGRGIDLDGTWELNSSQMKAINIITQLRLKYQNKIIIADWEEDKTTEKKMDYNHGGFSCGAGNLAWTVTENGNIRPCVFLPEDKFSTGNLIEDKLSDLVKKRHIENLFETLGNWEKELNSANLSTKNVCPVMSNYLEAYEQYTKSR